MEHRRPLYTCLTPTYILFIEWRAGGDTLDLRNNQITIGELLAHPAARQVLANRFPQLIGRPIVAVSGAMTLERAMKLGAAYVPRKLLQETLEELRRL